MPEFHYTARKPDGTLVQGLIEADDRAAAILRVERQFGVPIRIEAAGAETKPAKKSGQKSVASTVASMVASAANIPQENAPRRPQMPISSPSEAAAPSAKPAEAPSQAAPSAPLTRLPLAHLFLFTEQLAHLLNAGMTLDEALGILVRRLQQAKLKALSGALHQAILDGRSLSQALRDYPKIFSPLYVNMVAAGEVSGALPQILRRLVAHIADIKALRDRVQQALVYPAALVVVGIALIVLFMTVMVPQLTKFLGSTGQTLPPATQALISLNGLVVHYWWAALLALAAAVGLWKTATRSREGRLAWDRLRWRTPVASLIPRYRFYAQFARTLATLSENGVPLLRSLELLEEAAGNEWVRGQMAAARRAVMDGTSLTAALRPAAVFPELFLDMMSVGEQTGRFAETMAMVAEVHERELDKQIKLVSTIVPLVVIIAIALLVAVMVYAILSAVFGLTSGLQGRMH